MVSLAQRILWHAAMFPGAFSFSSLLYGIQYLKTSAFIRSTVHGHVALV